MLDWLNVALFFASLFGVYLALASLRLLKIPSPLCPLCSTLLVTPLIGIYFNLVPLPASLLVLGMGLRELAGKVINYIKADYAAKGLTPPSSLVNVVVFEFAVLTIAFAILFFR